MSSQSSRHYSYADCAPPNPDDVRPQVGTYSFKHRRGVEQFKLAKVVRHPNYTVIGGEEFSHDFTILKLKGRSSARPVKINRNPNLPLPYETLTVIGMGVLDLINWERPSVLQEAEIRYVPTNVCNTTSDPERGVTYVSRIEETHICTFSDFERDGCAYDSGGPIIMPGTPRAGSAGDVVVGLVSWGVGCADPVFPAVNARVSAVSAWIDETVCELSDYPPAEFCAYKRRPLYARLRVAAVVFLAGVVLYLVRQISSRDRPQYEYAGDGDASEKESFSTDSNSDSDDYGATEIIGHQVTW